MYGELNVVAALEMLVEEKIEPIIDHITDLLNSQTNTICSVKINEIRGMESNASFVKAKSEKGKIEVLSIFKNKFTGPQFLVGTKKLLNNITKIPQETQYKDLYDEIDPLQPQAVLQPEPQPQQLQAPNPPVNENVQPINPNEVEALGANNI